MATNVPDRSDDPKRRVEKTEESNPSEELTAGMVSPTFAEFAEAYSKAYKDHHDRFSWDNPDHYLNKAKY